MYLRREIGCSLENILLLSVGELNRNKNHEIVIRTLAKMGRKDVHYIIAGKGELMDYLKELSKNLGISDQVHFLGYCDNVKNWYQVSDIFVFPSLREGLSVALMEAMACGLPCVVSKIRGNIDLIDENGGALFEVDNLENLKSVLEKIIVSDRDNYSEYNGKKIRLFSLAFIKQFMRQIYGLK